MRFRARLAAAMAMAATMSPAAAAEPPQVAEAPAQRAERMGWWREARFGMFIHWGPVSLKGTEISCPTCPPPRDSD